MMSTATGAAILYLGRTLRSTIWRYREWDYRAPGW
jgi:hypothetical protein